MIAQTIQLALAPVFVLVAIGNILNLLSGRLGRVVDRSRHLQDRFTGTEGPDREELVAEIRMIEAALARIESGDYGICTKCGAQIGKERLDVVPFTPFCPSCARTGRG